MCETTPNPINETLEQTTEWNSDTGEQNTETQEIIETADTPDTIPEPTAPTDNTPEAITPTESVEIDETVTIEPTPENE